LLCPSPTTNTTRSSKPHRPPLKRAQVAPTFHIYRGKEKLGEMTGAKVDKLRELIETNL